MGFPLLFALLLSAATFGFSVFRRLFFSHGENLHPVAGTKLDQLIHLNRVHDYLLEQARKYTTFRLLTPGRMEIYTGDPAIVEHVHRTKFSNYGKGEVVHGLFYDLLGDGIFSVDGDKWKQQRKIASHEFSTNAIKDFGSMVFRQNAVLLAHRISDYVQSNKSFDVQDLLMKTTMDTICKIGFGIELNTVDDYSTSEESKRFATAIDDSSEQIFTRAIDLFWWVKRSLCIGNEAKLKKDVQVIDNFLYKLINIKRKQLSSKQISESHLEANKQDILTRLLLESEKDPETMNNKYLRDIILNFLVAGKDTTAGTLSWFFYMMCKHPEIQDRVAKDIQNASGAECPKQSMADFAENLSEETLDRMQYLHAALSETLRLYPAVPLDPKAALADDTLPDGVRVRKGDTIYFPAYGMGRLKSLWGDDAEEFRPERWLQKGVFRPESPFKFIAFQSGPRICLGKEFAYRQMKIFTAVLLHFLVFKLADEHKKVKYRCTLTLQIENGLFLLASSRKARNRNFD